MSASDHFQQQQSLTASLTVFTLMPKIVGGDLGLNISISTDVESAEDDVEVSGRGRHQQQQEVEVCVAQQALDVKII